MKHTPFRLAHLLELYAMLVAGDAPADQLAQAFCRSRPYLGSHDRAFLLDAVFALLRQRLRLVLRWQAFFSLPPSLEELTLTPGEEAIVALSLWLGECSVEGSAAPPAGLEAFLKSVRDDPDWHGAPDRRLRAAAAVSMPPFLLNRWIEQWGEDEALALAGAFGQPAPVDLRVNVARTSRLELQAALVEAGIESVETPHSPHGLRLLARKNLSNTPAFRDGLIEIQDEGSQLVALALDPATGATVLDACAGGGGKTLHLAALVGPSGRVLAYDREPDRLKPLRPRVERAGFGNVRTMQRLDQSRPVDAVLIDAPCSGLGTLRRHPDLAWRHGNLDVIARMAARQQECLAQYAPLVRPGGVLVYAVCSLEQEETSDITQEFCAQHPTFGPDPLPKLLAAAGHECWLLPHRSGTDGFYIARFRQFR